VTAVLFALEQLLGLVWPNYRAWVDRTFPADKRWKFFKRTILGVLVISGFLAWTEEHNKVSEKQAMIESQAKDLKQVPIAKQEVEQLRSEVTDLREKMRKMQGRHLSKGEEKELIRLLSTLGPHGVIVDHENGDGEAHTFAEELVALFKAVPGWKVGGANYVTQLGPRETGVILVVSDQGEAPQAVAIITASLKREEIAFALKKRKPTPENSLGPRVFRVFVRSRS
jgi:hypothetical protein